MLSLKFVSTCGFLLTSVFSSFYIFHLALSWKVLPAGCLRGRHSWSLLWDFLHPQCALKSTVTCIGVTDHIPKHNYKCHLDTKRVAIAQWWNVTSKRIRFPISEEHSFALSKKWDLIRSDCKYLMNSMQVRTNPIIKCTCVNNCLSGSEGS